MAANTLPIFSKAADMAFNTSAITGAYNFADLTNTANSHAIYTIYTATSTASGGEGHFIREVRLKVQPGTNTAATVVRLWLGNGGSLTTAANAALLSEISLPATTTSATAALPDFSIPVNMAIPPDHKLYLTLGTTTGAGAYLSTCVIAGKF